MITIFPLTLLFCSAYIRKCTYAFKRSHCLSLIRHTLSLIHTHTLTFSFLLHTLPLSPFHTLSFTLTLSLSLPPPHTVRARGKPSQEALKNILALEQSMPKVYKKIQAAESAPPPNKSQKGSSQPSSSNQNTTSAPPEAVSSGNSRFGNHTILLPPLLQLFLFSYLLLSAFACQSFFISACLSSHRAFYVLFISIILFVTVHVLCTNDTGYVIHAALLCSTRTPHYPLLPSITINTINPINL
jgi:hypothetical protein